MEIWPNRTFLKFLFVLIILMIVQPVFAGPGRTTYQAKIIKPNGFPLESTSVNFKFTILDPVGSCILYSETFSSVNMSSTGGLLSFSLGSGVKTYPVSATTFEQVFSNITSSLSCDTGGPVSYSPAATDIRKIVMQFHDGNGWQTLPAMAINAVPYAMYANEAQTLSGLAVSDFVQVSTVPTCAVSEALRYTGANFSCVAVGGGSGSVTSGSVITALGYTPADGASVTAVTATVFSVSSTVNTLSSTVASLSATVSGLTSATNLQSLNGSTSGTQSFAIGTGGIAPNFVTAAGVHTLNIPLASAGSVTAGLISNVDYTTFSNKLNATGAAVIAALGYTPANSATVVGSPWSTSGATINYNSGNVGIGTASPTATLEVVGSVSAIRVNLKAGSDANPSVTVGNNSTGFLGSDDGYWTFWSMLGTRKMSLGGSTTRLNGLSAYSANILLDGNNNPSTPIYSFYTDSDSGMFAPAADTVAFSTSGTEKLRVTATGNVGIGTTTPITKLAVSGGLRISMESAGCSVSYAGTLRYNSGNVEYCNGSAWSAFGVSGAGLQSLNGSTSGTQSFAIGTGGIAPAFNTSNGVHTLNIPDASAGATTAGLISNADYINFSNKMNATSSAVITALGYTPASSTALGSFLQISNNLSDIASATIARINLGLGLLATKSQIDLSSTDVSGTLSAANFPDSGVTAATYTKVTVDSKGRVTSGSQFSASDIASALGYTPANSATVTTSQWNTSGTTINYMSGNVGIGTTSPGQLLDVSGTTRSSVYLSADGSATNPSYSFSSDTGAGLFRSSATLYGFAIGGAWTHVLSTTRMGMNTGGASLFSTNTATSPSFSWSADADTGMYHPTANMVGFSTNATERLRIDDQGNVGIGTANPLMLLDARAPLAAVNIQSTTGTNTAYTQFTNTGGTGYVGVEGSVGTTFMSNGVSYSLSLLAPSAKPIVLGTNFTARMIVDPAGNVGIGTTTPSAKLDVSGDIALSGSASETAHHTGLQRLATGTSILWFGGGTSSLQIKSGAIGSTGDRVTITASGSVGIGTTTPASALEVNGLITSKKTFQVGKATINGSGAYQTVTFPTAFTNTNVVVTANYEDTGGGGTDCFVVIRSITATTFQFKCTNHDGVIHINGDTVHWQAIAY